MTKSAVQNANYKMTGDIKVDTGREPVQLGWYKFSSRFCAGKNVLDVGCGMGEGLAILSQVARTARGIDRDERLKKPSVEIKDIKDLEAKSIDVITCIDVIEHVEEDIDFARQLVRVARHELLISTPNWTVSRCKWPYHVREYMPHQIYRIFRPFGIVEMYKGNYDGTIHYKVKHFWAYATLNLLRVFPLTSQVIRVINHFLPDPARIHSSLFLHVRLGTGTPVHAVNV